MFDFDLTLADSTAGAVECVSYALLKMGLPPVDRTAICSTVGLSLPRIFYALTGASDPASMGEFSHWFVERADEVMADLTVMFPQVPGTLATLRRSGIRTAIVSTKFRRRIKGILAREKLADAFELIVGGEDVAQHKPDPEGLNRALAGLKVTAADSVYVGDHPVDAEAAQRAGVRFIAVLSGSSLVSDFVEYEAAGILSSLEELPPVLDGM
ncbi:MAG TPA: HAD-IA family hydrolase [Methylomirabilota bacterium]|nr:HAD-IA family hydrolase [Methylomirabilota bacterium]